MTAGARDRWFDLLRALALVRVFAYHLFSVAWLSFVFPAMGVMFALAGSLMARSLDRSPRRALTGRVRRLLPALWVLGAVLVPAMYWVGWPDRPAWPALLAWLVPLVEPPGNEWAAPATEVLWYLVTYLWLVLLSPAALRLYRRWPVPTVLLPLAAIVVLGTAVPELDGPAGSVVTDVATFGACWIVGFAHRDGRLRRIPLPVLVAVAALCVGFGVAWALGHRTAEGLDLNDIPLAQAFYSLGFVLLLLRAAPSTAWLARIRSVDRTVTALNNRAVTVYLWHNPAIALCFVLGDALGAWRLGTAGYLVVALVLVAAAVLLLGWVEDLAARRRPRLVPWLPAAAPVVPAPVPSAATRAAEAGRSEGAGRPPHPAILHPARQPPEESALNRLDRHVPQVDQGPGEARAEVDPQRGTSAAELGQ